MQWVFSRSTVFKARLSALFFSGSQYLYSEFNEQMTFLRRGYLPACRAARTRTLTSCRLAASSQMSVAVVGAGFAGLAVVYHLLHLATPDR